MTTIAKGVMSIQFHQYCGKTRTCAKSITTVPMLRGHGTLLFDELEISIVIKASVMVNTGAYMKVEGINGIFVDFIGWRFICCLVCNCKNQQSVTA